VSAVGIPVAEGGAPIAMVHAWGGVGLGKTGAGSMGLGLTCAEWMGAVRVHA
jgi:hypothetical protein